MFIPSPPNFKLPTDRANFSLVCWPATSSSSLAHRDRGLVSRGCGGGNTAKSSGVLAKCGLGCSLYICYWLIYYKNSALWVLLSLFYRKCARGGLTGFAQGHIESNLKSFTLSVGKGDGVCWCWWGLKWVGTQNYKPRTRGVPAEHLAVSQKHL